MTQDEAGNDPQITDDGPSSASDGSTRTGRPQRAAARKWPRWLAALVGVLVLLLLGGFFLVRHELSSAIHGISRQQLMPTGNRPAANNGPVTFLLAGTDSRDPAADPGNSDSMMIAYIPKDRSHVYLISVPRDLWVKIHGSGYAKINAAYNEGGSPLAISTLEDLFDVRIDHAAIMNFDGFMTMIDNLGGVDIYNPYETESVGNVYPEGMIHLDGDQALNYVRERHELENGDLDRTGRQRAVLKAVIQKGLSAGVMTNAQSRQQFFKDFANCVTLDSGLSDDDATNLLLSLKITSSDDVRSLMLPIGGYATAYDGGDIDVVDPQQVSDLAQAMRTDTMDQWWSTHSNAPLITNNMGPNTWSNPEGTPPPTAADPTEAGNPTTPVYPTNQPSAVKTRVAPAPSGKPTAKSSR